MKLDGGREPSLFTLLLLVSYPSVGAVLFTPALPDIALFFKIGAPTAQWAVTLFLFGYAIGQLPYGPLSNRIGRKPSLSIGILLSILASFLCAASGYFGSFLLFLGARTLAALGSSVGLMMTFTIIADYYPPPLARHKLTYVIGAFAVAPGAAAALGGGLTQWFSWESVFYFQGAYGILIWFLSLRLPETAAVLSKEPFRFGAVLESYLKRCRNVKLLLCGLILGCATAFVYVFAALAPFMALHILGLTPSQYGLSNLIPSSGMLLGSVLSRTTSHRISAYRSIFLGLSILAPAVFAMFLFFAFGSFDFYTLFIPYFFANIGITLVYINAPAIGTAEAKNKPNASAVLGFLNISICSAAVMILQNIDTQLPILMPLFFIGLLAFLFPLHAYLGKKIAP